MNSLLSSLKILDFTTLLPGPFATMALADLGADVLRIESPARLDLVRILPPHVDDEGTISHVHAYLNRNKKSMGLDLKNEESLPIIERLVKTYDIIVEQFRPGVMDRLGLSYERLSSINPELIYCSLTGYGQSGPWKNRAGHDINYLSLSGVMSFTGTKEAGPNVLGVPVADVGSGSYNTIVSILAAVIGRMESKKGQYIDISMTDGLFPYQALTAYDELYADGGLSYESGPLNGGSLYGFYETADGRYLSYGGLEPKFFNNFCDVLGLEDIKEGGAFQPGNIDDAKKRITEIIKSKPLDYWMEKFRNADACVEPVLTFKEAINSDHARERGVLADVPGPDGRAITQLACPVKFSEFNPKYERCGCVLGEHNEEVMKSLGFSDVEIEEIRVKGVFG